MSKTVWIILGIIIVLAALAVFAFRGDDANTTPETTATPTGATSASTTTSASPSSSVTATPAVTSNTVTFTGTGFSPETLTVPVGTTVTFKNEGNSTIWPASDPHPTHTRLGGFDAKRGIAKGESYSFTFTKAGTWGFHDHLNAGRTGTIIVE